LVAQRLSSHYLELLTDALLKVYWYRKTFGNALRRCGVSQNFLSSWTQEESKRDFLDRLIPKLEESDGGIRAINRLADTVLEQSTFPDLEKREDSKFRIQQAKAATAALREYRQRQSEEAHAERERTEARHRGVKLRAEAQQRQHQLEELSERLNALSLQLGTQQAGYDFERWFYDLVDYFEVENRRPYKVDGRQIDGSVTVDGTTYLVELKFTKDQSDAPDVNIFDRKVGSKADNTMGILASISGYSSVAVKEASRERTPLLLIDHRHIYFLLTGSTTFSQMIARLRRHSSQTGEAYLSVDDFGR
jgi:hypothetical protein